MSADPIVIVGAGMTGLTCARLLSDAGAPVIVLDKGRGIGGRMATRRTRDGWRFDHGAQYVSAKTEGFRNLLQDMQGTGAAAPWDDGSDRTHLVGTPGMSTLGKHLGAGLDIRQNTEVTEITQVRDGWNVITGANSLAASKLILTVPAPQARMLLGPDHSLIDKIAHVEMAPCLTLMATLPANGPPPFISHRNATDDLAWIACNSTKPGRGDLDTGHASWVAQASVPWSTENLERDRDEIALLMLPMLCDRVGAEAGTAVYAAGHRWRYAHVTTPLGQACLGDETGTLIMAGDWCIGPRMEAAWSSGTAVANAVLAQA